MGSGLILFVIVGAWLAVLVPMGLRSHDDAAPSRSVERFSDAMRVLSRRTGQPADAALAGDLPGAAHDADPGADPDELLDYPAPGRLRAGALRALDGLGGAREALGARLPRRLPSLPSLSARSRPVPAVAARRAAAPVPATGAARPGRSLAAVRRRRVLIALGGLAAAGLVAALVVPAALLLTLSCALLSVVFVVPCRRQARTRAAWLRNRAAVEAELSVRQRPLAEPARRRQSPHPAAVPVSRAARVPAARVPAAAGVEQCFDAAWLDEQPVAARTEQFFDLAAYERSASERSAYEQSAATSVAPARTVVRAALGAEWQPVPVPLPTYVGKPVAPARTARPAALRDQRQAHGAVLDDPGEQHREVGERNRAAAGW